MSYQTEDSHKILETESQKTSPALTPELMVILERFRNEIEAAPKNLPEWMPTKGASPNEIIRSVSIGTEK